jgi:hypothetical protein
MNENKLNENRQTWLLNTLQHLALTRQPCDICRYSAKPLLNVRVRGEFLIALMYGAGAGVMQNMLNNIGFDTEDGHVEQVPLRDIWIVLQMPADGIPESILNDADVTQADMPVGPKGETIRQIISETYKPENDDELDYFIRRYISA